MRWEAVIMVSLPASTWRDLLSVTSHHQMFPNKPPYQRMTSVSPLPSYMSGYLHQLGGHSSGVYRWGKARKTFLCRKIPLVMSHCRDCWTPGDWTLRHRRVLTPWLREPWRSPVRWDSRSEGWESFRFLESEYYRRSLRQEEGEIEK